MNFRGTQSAAMFILVLASILALPTETALADDRSVHGYWKHIDEDTGQTQSIFQLFEHKGKLVGRIEKIFPKPGKNAQTVCSECAGAQKNKPLVGLIFVWDFVRDQAAAGKWVDGKILNPADGKIYNAEAELSEDGKTLKVFGYIRILFKIGGSSVWQRLTAAELQGL
ncbi:MAG TPA: DUF2147 domain-containing protein [Polyangiaceae bacterium]|nr:DUF2147 domain-containing protein [Polyangiaceae bacterium]